MKNNKYTMNIYDNYYKYPVTSKESGESYEVKIYPYGVDRERYNNGCIVTLYKKRWFKDKELTHYNFENDEGKIKIYRTYDNVNTTYNYNMVDMTKLIVNLYEGTIKDKLDCINKIKKDFEEFKNWNGEV